MERGRITSVVSDTWGHGIVFNPDPIKSDHSVLKTESVMHHSSKNLQQSESTVTEEEVEEIFIPEDAEDVPVEGLSFLLSSLFATILEDVMGQMWYLDRCNNELQMIKTLHDIEHLKAIKYGVSNPADSTDDISSIDPRNLDSIIYKIKKLEDDRKYMNKVILATFIDLVQSYTFKPMVGYIQEKENLLKYRLELQEEEAKNKILRKELSRQVRQQRNHIKTVLYDTDVTIDNLKTEVEDSVLYCEVRNRYVDNWQNARSEQHNQVIFDIENVPSSQISFFKRRYEHEQRVHTEVELLVNLSINETLARIEEWMERYEKDMEDIDLKIQIKKNDYQNMRDRRMELEETLARHEVEMKAWIKFKEEREEARRYHELMTNSAIIVQAWWRGLIVRLQLGPFRVKKKPQRKKK